MATKSPTDGAFVAGDKLQEVGILRAFLAVGCVAAGALGQEQVGLPCMIGGATASAALKVYTLEK